MKKMTSAECKEKAKEYLTQISVIWQRIIALEMQEEKLRTKIEGVKSRTYTIETVQESKENLYEDMIAELIETQKEYIGTIRKLKRELKKREVQINRVSPQYAKMLRLKYLIHDGSGQLMTLRQVAKKTRYSYEWTRHIHGKALLEFYKLNHKTIKE